MYAFAPEKPPDRVGQNFCLAGSILFVGLSSLPDRISEYCRNAEKVQAIKGATKELDSLLKMIIMGKLLIRFGVTSLVGIYFLNVVSWMGFEVSFRFHRRFFYRICAMRGSFVTGCCWILVV